MILTNPYKPKSKKLLLIIMARVLLPCEVEEWWEDKRLFLLLSSIRSVKDLDLLIASHTRQDSEPTVLSKRLEQLSGLVVFLKDYCTSSERDVYMRETLPFIAQMASKLDDLVPDCGIPFIIQQEAASLVLGRKLVLCLIANAFLCTFPESGYKHMETFSFSQMFPAFKNEGKRLSSRAGKLKCILAYFQKAAENKADLAGMITIRRQVIEREDQLTLSDWTASQKPLCNLTVDETHTIESSGSHTLQVDFANKKIGGGVLRGGCVQEEIKFCLFPELLISRLIMDHMEDNEAIIITGAEQFSKCTGYGDTFEFAGEHEDIAERDVFGNILTSTVAIDAYPFGKSPEKQFEHEMILRELNKAYAGFMCVQDRGDISTELIALRSQGPSMAFIAEYYPNHHQSSTWSSDPPLGNLNSSSQLKPSLVEYPGPPPLSPIKELSESNLFANYADGIIKIGVHEATKKKTKETEDRRTVSDYASSLVTSLFSDVQSKPQPNGVTISEDQDSPVDRFASTVASSLFDNVRSSTTSKKNTPDPIKQPAGIDDLTFSLSSAILKSSMESETKKFTLDDAKAEEIARSIIADVYSSLEPTVSPEPSSTKTSGEMTNKSLDLFSDQMASDIVASAFSQPAPGSVSNNPTIFIQVERRGSSGVNESPKSSRSSSLTGQSITVHEFTDELAENLIRDGLSIAQYTSQSMELNIVPPQVTKEGAEQVAEKVTQSILDSLKESSKVAPPKTLLLTDEQPSSLSEQEAPNMARKLLKSRLLFSKQELAIVAARMSKRGSFSELSEHSDIDTPSFSGQLNPRLLTPSSSRHSMGYAWSTASTRDESSRPVSPTDLDRIALGLVSDPDDYMHIFTKILMSDAILSVCGERPKRLRLSQVDDGYDAFNMIIPTSESTIDSYLSKLEQAEVLSQSSGEEASFQQKLKTALLRPIATGNWGCGAFKGDRQVKCMLQWVVASMCDRPQMIYYTFNNQELKELAMVTECLMSKRTTTGQLCNALLDYANKPAKKRATKDLFTVLMETM